MNDVVTKEDLRDFREEMRTGIQDIKDRQDRTNGRLLEAERRAERMAEILAVHGEAMARLSENLKGLNKEVFERPRPAEAAMTQDLVQVLRTLTEENKPAFTSRDVKVLSGAGKMVWAIGGAVAPFITWLIVEWVKR